VLSRRTALSSLGAALAEGLNTLKDAEADASACSRSSLRCICAATPPEGPANKRSDRYWISCKMRRVRGIEGH